MYLGSAAFAGYCASQEEENRQAYCKNSVIKTVMLISSGLLGFIGECLLWTGQYVYIANSGPDKAKYNSIFFTVCQFAGLTANTFNYIYYSLTPNVARYFSIFFVFAVVGNTSMFFLPKLNKISETKIGDKKKIN